MGIIDDYSLGSCCAIVIFIDHWFVWGPEKIGNDVLFFHIFILYMYLESSVIKKLITLITISSSRLYCILIMTSKSSSILQIIPSQIAIILYII